MGSSSGVGSFCDPGSSTNNFPAGGSNSIYGRRQPSPPKKKRSLPGNPDPSAQVIALSPKTLMATNRFLCEICKKGFKRDQNLQLHLRGHNLPYKLREKPGTEVSTKKVYVCPEPTCVHHDPTRALGDLTGIKKHFFRKHGHKRWECDKCSKKYAVESDWRYHSRNCGTRTRVARVARVTKEFKCQCGAVFPSRRQCTVTHRAFCEGREESKTPQSPRVSLGTLAMMSENVGRHNSQESGKLVVSRGPFLMIPATSAPMSTTNPPTRSTSTSDHCDHRDSEIPNLALASQEEPPSKLLSPPPGSSPLVNNVSLSLRSSTLEGVEANHHRHPHGQSIPDHLSFNELIQKATEMAQMSVTRSSSNNYSSGIITMCPSKDGEFSRYDGHNNISSVQESLSHHRGASDGNAGMFSGNPIGSSQRGGEDIVTFDFLGIGIEQG